MLIKEKQRKLKYMEKHTILMDYNAQHGNDVNSLPVARQV
jgi:hypothetical protein